jgi:hypothetical protein
MRRLSRSLMPELPRFVRQPQYDRESLKMGMAHTGVGAFHRGRDMSDATGSGPIPRTGKPGYD